MIMQKEMIKYLKQVRKNCPHSFRNKLMTDLKNNLSDYLDENPSSTFDDVVNHFGMPQKFADEYILAMDEDTRKKLITKTKWLKRGILIGSTILLIIVAITAIWIIVENSQTAGYYYDYKIN